MKKSRAILLGPRALLGCIWDRAILTSSLVYGTSKPYRISSIIWLVNGLRNDQSFGGLDVLSNSWKCSVTSSSRSLPKFHSPLEFFKYPIKFVFLLWLALLWKNWIFLSPSASKVIRDLCFHIFSSISNQFWVFLQADLWSYWQRPSGSCASNLSSRSYAWLRLRLIEPNVVLFHISSSRLQLAIRCLTHWRFPWDEFEFQTSEMMRRQSVESIHIAQNLKSLFLFLSLFGTDR